MARSVRGFKDGHLSNQSRWCLWLHNASPTDIKAMPRVMERVKNVKNFRSASNKAATRELGSRPYEFAEIRQPEGHYIAIPRHSSERRNYIPFGYFTPDHILHDSCSCIPNADLYVFGVISSFMHMAWTRAVCGRIKSDYRYSNSIVYNNFPWPQAISDKKKEEIERAAQAVLNARDSHKDASLSDLYDPHTMPPDLVKAHRALDSAVDTAYSKKTFFGDSDRVAFLFALYQATVARLETRLKKPRKRNPG